MSDCPTDRQDDDTVDSSSQRALLVRGIPLSQPGRGTAKAIKDALRAIVVPESSDKASAGSKSTDRNKQQRPKFDCNVQFSLTVHRRIRNGCAVLIFPTPSQAQHVLQLVQARDASSLLLVQWPHTEQQRQPLLLLPVHIGGAAGRLRDHAFPDLPYSIRSQIRLDFTATYSLSDSGVANRMTTLFRWMHAQRGSRKIRILDAMACVGGNTIGMLRRSSNASLLGSDERENHRLLRRLHPKNDMAESPAVRLPPEIGQVIAVERDPDRYKLLEQNVSLVAGSETTGTVAQVSTICGCCFDYIAESMETGVSFDVVFFDPEWGGPEYKRRETELSPEQADQELGFYVSLSQEAADRLLRDHAGADLSRVPLESIILSLIELGVAAVISVALPCTKVGDRAMQRLAHGVTSDAFNNCSEQRPFPFAFNFGSTVQLLVLASGGDAFVDAHLDRLVHQIQREWHPKDGVGEHRPRFFDYEKNRWIELKKWISTARTCEAACS